MKLFTLRDVVLALLFALLTDAVYAGSSGPTPGQRENRRDQHNNGGQGQQGGGQFGQGRGGQIPQGGVQVLPAIPTDGGPAAPPVPNASPAVGNTNGPGAQPNQGQGKVQQLQQQLGLGQIVGKTPQAQPRPNQNQKMPPKLGDTNQRRMTPNLPPPAVPPRQLGDANQPGVPLQQGDGQFGQGFGNQQNPVAGPAVQPHEGQVPQHATSAQPSTHIFNPATQAPIQYQGSVLSDASGPYLDENGSLDGEPVGKLLGAGATSRVHESSDSKFVNKIISLNWGNEGEAAATIIDQNFGRDVLSGLKATTGSALFKVATLAKQSVISATQNGSEYRFVFNREENISSVVYAAEDIAMDKSNAQIADSSTKTLITVSNAETRAELRNTAAKKNKNGQPPLTDLEELTINLVIRTLNDHGIVWTDHKLANLDVVRNEDSPTGYQVIFFDFDGFRRVKGDDLSGQAQAKAARDIQKAFDNPALPNPNKQGDSGWEMMDNRVKQAYKKHYSNEYEKAGGNIPLDLGFDKTAFGGQPVTTLASPPANMDRINYLYYNGLAEHEFRGVVNDINRKYTLKIQFEPRHPIPPITIPVLRNKQP